jgi:hypothetical protein
VGGTYGLLADAYRSGAQQLGVRRSRIAVGDLGNQAPADA